MNAKALCHRFIDDQQKHPTVKEEYQESHFVFEGKVLSEKRAPESATEDEATLYTVQVLQRFKGAPERTLVIRSENNSARFPMTVGEKYLIFAGKDQNGLFIDNCGNSNLIKHSAGVMAEVKKLSHVK